MLKVSSMQSSYNWFRFYFSTRAIITRSLFETALDYKTRILLMNFLV